MVLFSLELESTVLKVNQYVLPLIKLLIVALEFDDGETSTVVLRLPKDPCVAETYILTLLRSLSFGLVKFKTELSDHP